jgi:hypothetical protein
MELAPFGFFRPCVAFEIGDDGFKWAGESDATTEDLQRNRANSGALPLAMEFLKTELANGPKATRELDEMAEARGISKKTLTRARSALGVHAYRVGDSGEKGAGHIVCSLSEPTVPFADGPANAVGPELAAGKAVVRHG